MRVGVHTLYNFVRVRTAASRKTKPAKPAASGGILRSPPVAAPTPAVRDGHDGDVWQRIEALKDRPVSAREKRGEVFHYDENVPLTVNPQKDDV